MCYQDSLGRCQVPEVAWIIKDECSGNESDDRTSIVFVLCGAPGVSETHTVAISAAFANQGLEHACAHDSCHVRSSS